ncbi:hypothetical protein SANTM175S_02625 [Streptomyces antimycoticus]
MRALGTVRQVMPARLRHRVDALQVTAVDGPGTRPNPQVAPGVLMTLSAAVRAREVLRFDYDPVSPPETAARADPAATAPRRVQPHHLVTRGGRWYLLAWDLDRDDWRTFRVDRITPRTPTGPRFTPRELPGGDVAAFVAGRFQGSDGTGGRPCLGEVVLDLPASVVSTYTRDGVVEELGPDRCRLVLGAWSWPGLAASIGRFDADIEVIGSRRQDAPYDVHEGVGRCRTGRHDTVGEHQPVDRHTAERPRPEQCGGDPLSQEAEATRDDDPHAFSPR